MLTSLLLQIRELITISREYILGVSIELERKRVTAAEPQNIKRQLELTAYFTHVKLQAAHQVLTLRQAMSNFTKARNYPLAATFAKRVSDLSQDERVLTSVSLERKTRSGDFSLIIASDRLGKFWPQAIAILKMPLQSTTTTSANLLFVRHH